MRGQVPGVRCQVWEFYSKNPHLPTVNWQPTTRNPTIMFKSILLSLVLLCLLLPFAQGQDIEQVVKEKAFDWTGSISANNNLYGVTGIPARSNPFFWNVAANMTGKVYGFSFPFSLTIGQHDYSISKPFLQAGISPSYKWIKLHLGTRNISYSPYTLAGHTFDGAGIELTPGKFNFSAMYGRFRKARGFDPQLGFRFNKAVYKRTGYAFKVGVGDKRNFFNISYLRAKDHPNSIAALEQDSTTTPGENAVIAVSGGFQISDFVTFFADAGASAFTRNVHSIETDDIIRPDISSIFTPRLSSRLNYAFKIGLNFDLKGFRLKTAYERIMPEFETMGSYFFANDRENITIAPSFSILNKKLHVNGNLGIQRNNLLKTRSETTNRLIGMANITYASPNGFSLNLNYTNFTVEQTESILELSDSIRVAMVTSNVSFIPTYSWSDSSKVQTVMLSGNYQQLNDRNPFTREFTNMTTYFFNSTYNTSFVRTGFGFNLSVNYTTIDIFNLKTDRYGGSFGINQVLAENKFRLNLTTTYNLTRINQNSDGAVISGNFSVSYTPHPKHSFSLNTNVLNNQSDQFDDYTEVYGGLSYVFRIR